jgi:hypothetical protein
VYALVIKYQQVAPNRTCGCWGFDFVFCLPFYLQSLHVVLNFFWFCCLWFGAGDIQQNKNANALLDDADNIFSHRIFFISLKIIFLSYADEIFVASSIKC